MGDGGQQGRAQPVGFRCQPRPVDVAGEADSLDGKCCLIAERFQQAVLIGAQQRTLPLGLEADDRRHAAAGMHGKEKPAGPAMRLALVARGAVAGPAPAGSGEIGFAQAAGRRVRRREDRFAALREQKQHDLEVQHQGDVVGARPEQILEGDGVVELAAEEIELLGGLGPLARGDRLAAHPRGEVADDDRHDHEGDHRDHILRVGDRRGVERRQEEEVVGDHAEQAGEERRP